MLFLPKCSLLALLLLYAIELNSAKSGHEILRSECESQTENIGGVKHKFYYDQKYKICYFAAKEKLSRENALAKCKGARATLKHFKNGYLARIVQESNKYEFKTLVEKIEDKLDVSKCGSDSNYWLSAENKHNCGNSYIDHFFWTHPDDKPSTPIEELWITDEPDDDKHCCVDFNCSDIGLEDMDCATKRRYICQQYPREETWCKDKPKPPLNSHLKGNNHEPYPPGHTFTAECNPGYQLEGKEGGKTQTITCNNKNWSPTINCQKTCSEPTAPSNAKILQAIPPYYANSYVRAQCLLGFEVYPTGGRDFNLKCTNSDWTGKADCRRACEAPNMPTNTVWPKSTPAKGPFFDKYVLTAECETGTTVSGSKRQTTICDAKSGTWEPTLNGCMKDCPKKNLPEIGHIRIKPEENNEYHHNKQIQVSCNEGSKWNGRDQTLEIKCDNGKWMLNNEVFVNQACTDKDGKKVSFKKKDRPLCGWLCALIIIASIGGASCLVACVVFGCLISKGEREDRLDETADEDMKWAKRDREQKRKLKKQQENQEEGISGRSQ